ncbi:glutamate cyclase domain-containing protein [Breoghania corrubedonensis]|nr:glutamate cyclase domain-containing protein [Breoghania corrubedonensis]
MNAAYNVSRSEASQSRAVDESQVRQSQDKLKFALLDSGMGGGMTAALLGGEVRQLGSYFCLPIGDKQPAVAEAYTAVMALWPMIMPLANSNGELDGKVAENVIIACNSASVRKEGAVDLMAKFCAQAAASDFEGVGDRESGKALPQLVKKGLEDLAKVVAEKTGGLGVEDFQAYFTGHVHEIVSKTAEKGALEAVGLLKEKSPDADPLLVRIDSTNGTAGSQAYPTKIRDALERMGGEVSDVEILGSTRNPGVGDTGDTITHHVISLRLNGEERTIVVEGRGNQPWVKAVEGGTVAAEGADLVRVSNENSEAALGNSIAQLRSNTPREGTDPAKAAGILAAMLGDNGRRVDDEGGQGVKPDLSMLCCTHYPAMKDALVASYGEDASQFIDQATIVRDLVHDDLEVPVDGNQEPLELALTVGSMNYGGADEKIRPSIANGFTSANVLADVLEQTMDGDSSNVVRSLGSVKVFHQNDNGGANVAKDARISNASTQGGSYQEAFELLHQMMVTGEQDIKRFYESQNLAINPAFGRNPESPDFNPEAPRFTFVGNERRDQRIQPNPERLSEGARTHHEELDAADMSAKLDRLGTVMTLGESRGIDKIAPLNDQGAQLKAATAQLMDVVIRNRDIADPTEREPVGIMTGFSVVRNEDRTRVAGENDGPPGAVLMGKTLVDQETPVVFVTDRSAQASLYSSLLGAGLAELTSEGKLFLELRKNDFAEDENGLGPHSLLEPQYVKVHDLVKVEIPQVDYPQIPPEALPLDDPDARETMISQRKAANREAVLATAETLKGMNVNTMISIERPSVTELDGGSYSMVAVDVAPFNPDLSPLLGSEDIGFAPFTIGIGDGGNELGTGGIQFMTSEGRDHEMLPFVKGGSVIGAKKDLATDVMLLSTVSNNGGMAVSMSLLAALAGDDDDVGVALDATIDAYNDTIAYLAENGMSIDGVNKENLNTVDGRRMGTRQEAGERWEATQGKVPLGIGPDYQTPDGKSGSPNDTSHNDTFLRFRNIFAPVN